MKNYIGSKIIKAEKVTFNEYLKIKYGPDVDMSKSRHYDLDDLVYVVVYPPIGKDEKPYVSMSPVEVFEKAYREIEAEEYRLISESY
jgi:hypothetical protein